MKNKGFTLVELLVVVAIIAILSVIGLTVFSGSQANARDARRKADIDAITKVIETTRAPGTVYYLSLPATGFSTGAAPVDSTTAKYCIRTSTAATVAEPTTWAATDACPTAPIAATGDSAWTAITSAGLAASAVAGAPFVASTISWKVCARLESNVFYCKPSSQ